MLNSSFNVCVFVCRLLIDSLIEVCVSETTDRESAVDTKRASLLDEEKEIGEYNRKVQMLFSGR